MSSSSAGDFKKDEVKSISDREFLENFLKELKDFIPKAKEFEGKHHSITKRLGELNKFIEEKPSSEKIAALIESLEILNGTLTNYAQFTGGAVLKSLGQIRKSANKLTGVMANLEMDARHSPLELLRQVCKNNLVQPKKGSTLFSNDSSDIVNQHGVIRQLLSLKSDNDLLNNEKLSSFIDSLLKEARKEFPYEKKEEISDAGLLRKYLESEKYLNSKKKSSPGDRLGDRLCVEVWAAVEDAKMDKKEDDKLKEIYRNLRSNLHFMESTLPEEKFKGFTRR